MNPKSGRWGGWRFPVNIWVPIILPPITLHPKQEAPHTTPTSAAQRKGVGVGASKVTDPKSMGPCGGKNSSRPFASSSPSSETVQPPSTGLLGLLSHTLEIRAAKGPLTFPRAIPDSTFRTSLERVPGGSHREQLQCLHRNRQRSNMNFLKLGTPHTHTRLTP